MTIYEKYKELVIECIEKDNICKLAHTAYGDTQCGNRLCDECHKFTAEWLNRECIEIDWAKVPVDTPVIIKAKDGVMFRHFAKYWQGHVLVYANGRTSWTNDGETHPWEPEDIELARNEDAVKYAK